MRTERYYDSRNRYAFSEEATKGADSLIKKINEMTLMIELLPNTSVAYCGEAEHNDFISYREFLISPNGRFLIDFLEAEGQ